MSVCLIDNDIPAVDRPAWSTGYYECGAGLALAEAQAAQAKRDETTEKRTGKPVTTSHRLWQVAKAAPPEPAE